jgi:hypothetical protein
MFINTKSKLQRIIENQKKQKRKQKQANNCKNCSHNQQGFCNLKKSWCHNVNSSCQMKTISV